MKPGTAHEGDDRRRAVWMGAAQDGDRAAYEALLRDCVPLIRGIARSQGVAAGHIEDVVQDVLLTVHRVRHTYDPTRPFDAWLGAISRRRAIDALRRTARHNGRETHEPTSYETHADEADPPDRVLEAKQRARHVRQAVASLPPRQREAVEHLSLAERSLAEAAAATGRSEGALKVNLHRALNALRIRLGRHD
jgi:RNA polymerase sigma factor (sigma-70 family)